MKILILIISGITFLITMWLSILMGFHQIPSNDIIGFIPLISGIIFLGTATSIEEKSYKNNKKDTDDNQ